MIALAIIAALLLILFGAFMARMPAIMNKTVEHPIRQPRGEVVQLRFHPKRGSLLDWRG
jgi:hypothetical protein